MILKAVIFDLDGTVVADELMWGKAFRDVLTELGGKVDTDYPHKGGIGIAENWPYLLEKYDLTIDLTLDELTTKTYDAFWSHLSEVRVKNGFFDFSKDLKDNGVRRVLATSSMSTVVQRIMNACKLENEFEAIVTGGEVQKKKPDPEIFIRACAVGGFEPQYTVVIEDSDAGFEAAHAAGMNVIAIRVNPQRHVDEGKADLVVGDFSELSYMRLVDQL